MQQIIQTVNKTVHALTNLLRRGAGLTQTAGSRPSETCNSGEFMNSRSGEAFSPERDRASLKTRTSRLGERSRQNHRRASDILV